MFVYVQCVIVSPVMLQPSMDLSSVDKSKHKFMVQSMFAPPDFISDNLDQMVGLLCLCMRACLLVCLHASAPVCMYFLRRVIANISCACVRMSDLTLVCKSVCLCGVCVCVCD